VALCVDDQSARAARADVYAQQFDDWLPRSIMSRRETSSGNVNDRMARTAIESLAAPGISVRLFLSGGRPRADLGEKAKPGVYPRTWLTLGAIPLEGHKTPAWTEGDGVAELYIHQRVASVTAPGRGAERVPPGDAQAREKTTVEFLLAPEALSLLDVNMNRVVEPGTFDLLVGPSSVQTESIPLQVPSR
jgi:hypothetical protein